MLIVIVNFVFLFQSLRVSSVDSLNADAAFMSLMGECQHSAGLKESAQQGLSESEIGLFALNPPGDVIDANWIKATEKVISDKVQEQRAKLKEEQNEYQERLGRLHLGAQEIKKVIGEHLKLMSDVGTLLRSIAKSEDYDIPQVHAYLAKYKGFSELVTLIVNSSLKDEQTEETLKEVNENCERLKEVLSPIYEEIVGFSRFFKEEDMEEYKTKKKAEEEDEEKRKANQEQVINNAARTI